MAKPEIDFCIIRDKEKTIGFSLVSCAQTEAEYFCAKFPKALVEGKADIKFKKGTVTFEYPEEGTCDFEIGAEDVKTLKNLLEGKGEYKDRKLSFYNDGFLTPGFKLVLEGMKDLGEKDPVINSLR